MVWSIDYVPICLSLEQVAMRAGNEVWMEISNNSALIVGDPNFRPTAQASTDHLIRHYY